MTFETKPIKINTVQEEIIDRIKGMKNVINFYSEEIDKNIHVKIINERMESRIIELQEMIKYA